MVRNAHWDTAMLPVHAQSSKSKVYSQLQSTISFFLPDSFPPKTVTLRKHSTHQSFPHVTVPFGVLGGMGTLVLGTHSKHKYSNSCKLTVASQLGVLALKQKIMSQFPCRNYDKHRKAVNH